MIRSWTMPTAAWLLLSLISTAVAQSPYMAIEDVRPGMKGVGKTCFSGTRPEEFQVEILGVMRGIGPGADAVLARLSGGPLDKVGVFEGMSGSPVYLDGKLLGAVAFSFPFAKEPIAGITPIVQMVKAFDESGAGPITIPKVRLNRRMLWDYPLRLPSPEDSRLRGSLLTPAEAVVQPALSGLTGHSLLPIATPIHVSGLHPETLEYFGPQFRSLGMTLLQGRGASSGAASTPDPSPLEAGSNIVIPLVRGDMDASAGGTVTHVKGDEVYAFGHLLFNLGFLELPMHKARALTVFPSLQSSFKILETSEPVGVLRQDRSSGIYGILGQKAAMIPVHVDLKTSRGQSKELHYEIARDRFLTPFLVNFTVFNSIVGSERALGVSTVELKGTIRIKGEQPVELENRFSSDSNSPAFASLSVALPVNFLLASGYKDLEFEAIDLNITALEDDRAAVLDSVRYDRSELKAGDTVRLDLYYKKADGEIQEDSYPIQIPRDVTPGPVTILVADGTRLMELDAREQGEDIIPRDLSQLIRFINNIRKNDRLYVRIFRREPGEAVSGEGLPGLPPSILSILRSDRNTGGSTAISVSTFMEYELPPSRVIVSGSKTLNLVVKP